MSFDPFMCLLMSELDAEEERENERDSYDNHWSDNNDGSDNEEDDY